MKAPGREVKTVKAQLDDVARFYKKIENLEDMVIDSARTAENLADGGHGESDKARDQVRLIKSFFCRKNVNIKLLL